MLSGRLNYGKFREGGLSDSSMRNVKIRTHIVPFVTILIILAASVAVIAYGRGYRPDFGQNIIKATGLLSVTSDPIGAQVYVDGKLKTATNNAFNIDPDWYTVRIVKEGYIAWEKKVRVQGEIVTRADAFLFPLNPSLSPVTSTGIENPVLSPDGTKIAYATPVSSPVSNPSEKPGGLWVYELVERPLGRNRDPRQIGVSEAGFDFSTATIVWSPDSTQIMADNGREVRLYQSDRAAQYRDVSTTYQAFLNAWRTERQTKELQKLAAFKQPIVDLATASARIISFSPDESKILYEATAAATIPPVIDPPLIGTNSTEETRKIELGNIYMYDSHEDKNYFVLKQGELPDTMPTPSPRRATGQRQTPRISDGIVPSPRIYWFPTSRHLVLPLEGKIDIMEYDRTNWITVYSGPFVDSFIAPWPTGSRIIIVTNLNPDASTLPNLYTVNLR